mmetsp:Transcript_23188/g.54739  ORF Transcript_23188/g.54739 Transcript_23188/m.54739 type:complete len:625 (-) Transcript_23188:159-2033(-)
MDVTSHRNDTPLLQLLDGILSQNEEHTNAALAQIEKLDPCFGHHNFIPTPSKPHNFSSDNACLICDSPLRSSSALEAIVRRLLAVQPHLAQVSSESDGSLPLHFAASIGNIRIAALLIGHYREAALAHNTKGKIPLHYAAREGRTEMVNFLLRFVPACAAVLTKKGKLALHFAAGEGHIAIVRDLLRVYPAGAVLPSKKGKIAMHFAARWGHMEIVRDLYRLYPESIETLDYDGSNPLHDATREGQLEMAKFLVEKCPSVMTKSNIRGEIPLFAAIRSGNVQLCAFLIRAWPGSGKQVLQTISDRDDVTSWKPAILDLCLRGAVANFSDLTTKERVYVDDHGPTVPRVIGRVHHNYNNIEDTSVPSNGNAMPTEVVSDSKQQHKVVEQESDDGICRITSETSLEVASISMVNDGTNSTAQLHPDLDISLPRSKSPILETNECGKRRSSSNGSNSNKRQCRGNNDHDCIVGGCEISFDLKKQTFYQLHAALECSATTSVLKCVLDRYPKQHTLVDDFGRLPLHIAISQCRSEGCVELILERIWKRNPEACFERDNFGRLPLHLALMTRADARLVGVLIEAHPSSAVERFARRLPIHIATASGCDLSTSFMLIRGDPAMVQTWNSH